MFVKQLISNFLTSSAKKWEAKPLTQVVTQCIKTYKKTGIRLREAILLNSEGGVSFREGGAQSLTTNDIKKIHAILAHGDECREVLHLDSLYFCVKELTDRTMALFNGTYYIIACLTDSKHLVLVSIRAKRTDGDKSLVWIQGVAEQLNNLGDYSQKISAKYDPQAQANILDWF